MQSVLCFQVGKHQGNSTENVTALGEFALTLPAIKKLKSLSFESKQKSMENHSVFSAFSGSYSLDRTFTTLPSEDLTGTELVILLPSIKKLTALEELTLGTGWFYGISIVFLSFQTVHYSCFFLLFLPPLRIVQPPFQAKRSRWMNTHFLLKPCPRSNISTSSIY